MRSVGVPELEFGDADAPVPEIQAVGSHRPALPIIAILAMAGLLLWGLSALGGGTNAVDDGPQEVAETPRPEPIPFDEPEPLPADTPSSETTTNESTRGAVNLLALGGGAHVAVDEIDEPLIRAVSDGFIRIGSVDEKRSILFSQTGAAWNSESSDVGPGLNHGMPLVAIDTNPENSYGVVVFRSADGVVISSELDPSDETSVTVPALPEARVVELVVGDEVAYLTLSEPTGLGDVRYSVLQIGPQDFSEKPVVTGIDLSSQVGEGYERLRDGTVLADGTVMAIASNRHNTTASLVEVGPNSVAEIIVDETPFRSVRRISSMHARGNGLVAVDRDGLVYTWERDTPGFAGSTETVHPILSASRNGLFASLELGDKMTTLRVWSGPTAAPRTIQLDARIEPVEVVDLNEDEVLLASNQGGERWLISVPIDMRRG